MAVQVGCVHRPLQMSHPIPCLLACSGLLCAAPRCRCRNIRGFMADSLPRDYEVFRHRVTEEEAPGYFEVTRSPMDFDTISGEI